MINERKDIVQEWSMFLDNQYDLSTINSGIVTSRNNNNPINKRD